MSIEFTSDHYVPKPATGGAGDRIPPRSTAVGLQDEGDGSGNPIEPLDESGRLNRAFGDQLPGIGVPLDSDRTAARILEGLVNF